MNIYHLLVFFGGDSEDFFVDGRIYSDFLSETLEFKGISAVNSLNALINLNSSGSIPPSTYSFVLRGDL